MRNFLRYWRDPGYWRWRWNRVGGGAKLLLAVGLGLLVGAAGYATARTASEKTQTAAFEPPRANVVTVIGDLRDRTVIAEAVPRTVATTVTLQGDTPAPVVQTETVVQPQTVERPVTVTKGVTRAVTVAGPAKAVTTQVTQPARTVTKPAQTVAQPSRTVTNTATVTNTDTVTQAARTVTQPSRTVTDTNIVTTTNTVTNTVTQPAQTVTVTVTTPKPK